MLSNLKLAYNLILIRLSDTTTSGTFELEKKEYQRKNIGIIEKISDRQTRFFKEQALCGTGLSMYSIFKINL